MTDQTPEQHINELNEHLLKIKRDMLKNMLAMLREQHQLALEQIDEHQNDTTVDLLMNGMPALLKVAEAALKVLEAADNPSPLEFITTIENLASEFSDLEALIVKPDDPDR